MNDSVLTKSQTKTFGPRAIAGYGKNAMLTAIVRYDDECGNGHNSFSITGEVVTPTSKRHNDIVAGGCMHEDIARVFPELAQYIKWHLTSSDGPMHYVANTLYWLGYQNAPGPNLEHARNTAVWPDMPEDMLIGSGKYTRQQVQAILEERQAALQVDFRAAVESLGFTW